MSYKVPVHKCPNGKYKIGSGPCMYTSKAKAERAYAAYRAQKHDKKMELEEVKQLIKKERENLQLIRTQLEENKDSYNKYIEELAETIKEKVKKDDDDDTEKD